MNNIYLLHRLANNRSLCSEIFVRLHLRLPENGISFATDLHFAPRVLFTEEANFFSLGIMHFRDNHI